MLEAPIGVGSSSAAYRWANIVNGLPPVLERFGIAGTAEVDVATLTERLDAEIDARDGILLGPPLVGAWTRTPHH